MEPDCGKQIYKAMLAVLDMHEDSIRLFRDLDRAFLDYESVFGNVVTTELGSSISRGTYLADGLIRLYVRAAKRNRVLGINICFYDTDDPKFLEPIFVVANTVYESDNSDPQERWWRGWEPWNAFLCWAPRRAYGTAMKIEKTESPKTGNRSGIEAITVAAAPLYTITNLKAATDVIDLVGRP
jgi:hypothetical protein